MDNYDLSSSDDEFTFEAPVKKTFIDEICDDNENNIDNDDDNSEISENQESDTVEWSECDKNSKTPSIIKFDTGKKLPGPQVSAFVKQPIEFFKLFFTDELVMKIIADTNDYAAKKIDNKKLSSHSIWRSWYDITNDEFWAFLAVIINMGTMPLPNLQDYWSTNPNSLIPFYPNTFTRDRFMQIFWMLHAKIQPDTIRPEVISGFLDYINGKFIDYFIPSEQICVDESIVKFKGRISFITYNPQKPTKWGIKVYTLADSNTGYICQILPYYGSLTTQTLIRPDLPVSTRIPLHLCTMLLKKIPEARGYHLFTDRYYTSLVLADELHKLNCHLTGTIMNNRKGLPPEIKKPKFNKNVSIKSYRRKNNLIITWKDKRIVTLFTNRYNPSMKNVKRIIRNGVSTMIKKPNAILNYSKYMGGVDKANQFASTYCFMRKSIKWWKKLFFWGMEISIINSFILYKEVKKKNNEESLSHLQYIKTLVDELKGSFVRYDKNRYLSSHNDTRMNGKLHIMLTGKKKDCVVCSNRVSGKRHETTYFCDSCPDKPRLHLGTCFRYYHTHDKYKK
uniref:PiggyBac transposable element-derived protein 4-like n=1 Tax=Dermatophagoides pteronyssinus TaxID=6956 RepID=A0A6P6XZF7_DERPT|nr:piggyBac transposable element-derived protein 4-like [Dermatophagoides pteronyssinus]